MILVLKIMMASLIEFTVLMLCRLKVVFYRNRPVTLRQLVYSLQTISNKMVFSNDLLPDLVNRMAEEVNEPVSALWLNVSENLTMSNMTFSKAFQHALENQRVNLSLVADDIACLELLSQQLGQTDLDNQITMIKITMDKLLMLEKQSVIDKKQQVRLWNMLGVLGGVSIIILLW